MVPQRGGTLGTTKQIPCEYFMMQPGERYILILREPPLSHKRHVHLVQGSRAFLLKDRSSARCGWTETDLDSIQEFPKTGARYSAA